MADRYRNKRIEVQLTEEEFELFKKKMVMGKSKSMSHFIRESWYNRKRIHGSVDKRLRRKWRKKVLKRSLR